MTAPAPLVIAHRGASGYLPEHTLEAKALAYGLGADFLEQDVVATRDDELIVLHDIHLDTVTDVAQQYPDRARADGRWYARDFDLAEIRRLRVFERTDPGGSSPIYPTRFPHRSGRFRVPALIDELEMIVGLNRATGRNVGVYPEIKKPAWHHAEGVDVAANLLAVLDVCGYRRRGDAIYLQCFDPIETRRLREDLGTELRIVQLIADNAWGEADTDFAAMLAPAGMAAIAEYADAVGPWLRQLYTVSETAPEPATTGVTALAHAQGLAVHPYTFRADELPPGFDDYATLVRWFRDQAGIDALFTDFTDLTLRALGR